MSKKYDWLANITLISALVTLIKYNDNFIVAVVLSIIILASLDYKYKDNWLE
jgi:hypothetical protein